MFEALSGLFDFDFRPGTYAFNFEKISEVDNDDNIKKYKEILENYRVGIRAIAEDLLGIDSTHLG